MNDTTHLFALIHLVQNTADRNSSMIFDWEKRDDIGLNTDNTRDQIELSVN